MQYFEILNLKSEPFSNSPDPEFFYGSREHAECLRKVEIAIRLRRGLNLVYGEVGTGKTTLCRQLLRVLARDPEVVAHLVLDPSFSTAREFLTVLHRMFLGAEPPAGASEFALKEAIKNALFRLGVEEGKTVVLIVDEGQKAGGEFLELLRELLNYETNEAKLLQIVIFGQREFLPLLQERPNLADRVNLSMELGPLDLGETREMIAYRLSKSASTFKAPRVFTEGALKAIHSATGGYPRKVIGLCHRVLLAMLVQNRTRADRAMVRAVLEGGGQPAPRTHPAALAVVLLSLVLAVILGAGAFMGPDTVPGRAYRYFSWWANEGLSELFGGQVPVHPPAVFPPPALRPQAPPPPASPAPAPAVAPPALSEPAEPASAPAAPAKPEVAPARPDPAPAPAVRVPADPAAPAEKAPAAVLAPSPADVAPAWGADLPPGCPPALGRLRIVRGETLSDVISKVYGVFRVVHLRRVEAANPGLENSDLVPAGSAVALPSIPMALPAAARDGYWLRLDSFSSLQQAWDFLPDLPAGSPKARLVPWWTPAGGLRFEVVAQGPFRSAAAAEELLRSLSPDLAARAQVVRLDGEGAVYFTDITGWKL
jgi:general secretion pathway protein A